jgi:hypothetical protein
VLIDPPIQAAATIWNDVVDQYQQPVEKFITDALQQAAPAK